MAAATSGPSSNAASLVDLRDLAISGEPDRYFAATLAPAVLRYDLIVLAAFAAEIARVPGQVREPLAGEIRLQWWRDALIGGSSEAAAGHPVATAMRATMRRFGLQPVAWQTGFNPVVAMELLAEGAWSGAGVVSAEAFDPDPYLAILDRDGIHHATIEIEPGTAVA